MRMQRMFPLLLLPALLLASGAEAREPRDLPGCTDEWRMDHTLPSICPYVHQRPGMFRAD